MVNANSLDRWYPHERHLGQFVQAKDTSIFYHRSFHESVACGSLVFAGSYPAACVGVARVANLR